MLTENISKGEKNENDKNLFFSLCVKYHKIFATVIHKSISFYFLGECALSVVVAVRCVQFFLLR
jgi:hypothetical protein